MMFPVRCFTCGKPIGQFWAGFKEGVAKGEKPKIVLDGLGVKRYCCRAIFVSNADLIDDIAQYKKF
jgi:DNA-directed RNA polymerase subunit N